MEAAVTAHDQDLHDHELEDHDRGLSHDLPTLLSRRRALALFSGGGAGRRAGRLRADRRQRRLHRRRRFGWRRVIRRGRGGHHRGRVRQEQDPRGDGRALPRRRVQRGQRPHRERHRPQRHHPELPGRRRGWPRACP